MEGEGGFVSVFRHHQVPHFIVNTDHESPSDPHLLKEPFNGHQQQVEEIYSRALNYPVDSEQQSYILTQSKIYEFSDLTWM